jgi:hypothetical protein
MASWYRVDMSAFRMDIVMVAVLIFFAVMVTNPLNAWSLFGSKPLTPEEKIQQLQQQQVDHPDDPVINYNLGVALYRMHKFDQAKANFERTLAHTKNLQLETQTLFNMANASLKHALATLPPTWEQEETIEPQLLDNAISLVMTAIENYQKFLTHQPEHTAGSTNQKYAEEIKKKLEEKKKQQQQQNKQDKQNDKQEKSQDNKRDQQKDQKNDKQEQQQNKQDEHKQDQQKEQRNEQNDQKQQQSEQQKQEQASPQQNAQQQQAEPEQTQAAQAQQSQESSEERRMRALLENLQSDETERQKARVRQNAMNQQPPQQGQKPW